MFADYAERGRRFKDAVARLAFEVQSVRAVSSHQSGRGDEELTAGNTGRPGL